MGKDLLLVNIYIKIHKKQSLTLDDVSYLAKYEPECFEKTCKNVVNNIPETKVIMEPASKDIPDKEQRKELFEGQYIEKVLENLKRLEANDFPVADVDADEVKSLLGNLYMELLFPHNDKDAFMNTNYDENTSLFDKKV